MILEEQKLKDRSHIFLQNLRCLSKKTEDELDEEISKSISILGRMMASVSKGESAKTKESSDVEPSTGNSAFDDFLKDIFGGGAK